MGEHMSIKIASQLQASQLPDATAKPALEESLAQQTFSERTKEPPSSPVEPTVTRKKHAQPLDHRTTKAILKILNEERSTSRS